MRAMRPVPESHIQRLQDPTRMNDIRIVFRHNCNTGLHNGCHGMNYGHIRYSYGFLLTDFFDIFIIHQKLSLKKDS